MDGLRRLVLTRGCLGQVAKLPAVADVQDLHVVPIRQLLAERHGLRTPPPNRSSKAVLTNLQRVDLHSDRLVRLPGAEHPHAAA